MASVRTVDPGIGEACSEEELRLRITLSPSCKDANVSEEAAKTGLHQPLALLLMSLWYIFSALTLFANKYILSYMKGDPALLAMGQMLMCVIWGSVQLHHTCGLFPQRAKGAVSVWPPKQRPSFLQPAMLTLGALRFSTLVLGLITLNYVAVSFTETVKSSAPIFTVIITRLIIGEKTGFYVNISLLPIVAGLALCSATELSFNVPGFTAALFTNLSECLQNVYSKLLLSGERHKYGPAELQFNTSLASLSIQLLASWLLVDWSRIDVSWPLIGAVLANGTFFHVQSMTEYALLEHIAPVTHSVANTVKRALMIWLSILVFGNAVTPFSAAGTLIVIGGVIVYNKARQWDADRLQRLVQVHPQKISL